MFIAASAEARVLTTDYFRSWEELEQKIRNCTRCSLYRFRKNIVLGEGSRSSPLMLIGEAPGATEDEMGRPFVGAAGKLLTLTLESIGIRREETYITNVVKCRPPQNREPRDEEVESCSVFLESQILLIRPRVIATLGNVAGKRIFSLASRPWSGVTRMRGQVYNLIILGLSVLVVPTVHPAAALYNPSLRNILLNDLRLSKDLLASSATPIGVAPKQDVDRHSVGNRERRGARTLVDYIMKG